MTQQDLLFDQHFVAGLYPVADAFAGGVSTDIVSLKHYRRCTFVVMTGAIEDAGISNLLTVDACSTSGAAATTAVTFKWRVCRSSTTVDTWGALTASAATGYNAAVNNAVANAIWVVEVTADQVQAESGYEFVRLTIAETANKTITAGCLIILSEPRYPSGVPVTAIS